MVANEHGGLKLAGDARAIMRGDQNIQIAIVKPDTKRRAGRPDNPIGNPLFEALRAKRRPNPIRWRWCAGDMVNHSHIKRKLSND
jgi:hypothetical protein